MAGINWNNKYIKYIAAIVRLHSLGDHDQCASQSIRLQCLPNIYIYKDLSHCLFIRLMHEISNGKGHDQKKPFSHTVFRVQSASQRFQAIALSSRYLLNPCKIEWQGEFTCYRGVGSLNSWKDVGEPTILIWYALKIHSQKQGTPSNRCLCTSRQLQGWKRA